MAGAGEGAELKGKLLAGDFKVIKRIAIGAFTKVYLAVQESVPQRQVVIRLLHEIYLKNSSNYADKMKREAFFMGQLKSPCFPRIITSGKTSKGLPFIVMEYVEGPTLEKLLKSKKRLPMNIAIDLALQLLEGIEEMHMRGILHRDIKPGNIAVETLPNKRQYLKILDLGTAIYINDAKPQIKDEKPAIIGTPAYVAPEQVREGVTNVATDIYQLSATLYELFTGVKAIRPKQKDLLGYVEYLKSDKPIPTYPMGELRSDIPNELELIIEKGLYRDPKRRWPSVTKMMHAFLDAVKDMDMGHSGGLLGTIRRLFGK